MTVPEETAGLDGVTCMDCKVELELAVLHSMAGYYLGYFCPNCGPYSRETGYFKSWQRAKDVLEAWVGDGTVPDTIRSAPPTQLNRRVEISISQEVDSVRLLKGLQRLLEELGIARYELIEGSVGGLSQVVHKDTPLTTIEEIRVWLSIHQDHPIHGPWTDMLYDMDNEGEEYTFTAFVDEVLQQAAKEQLSAYDLEVLFK